MTVPADDRHDRLQGYRGPAREVLDRFQVGVWSEVEVTNDEGSTFTGVILPRNETCDDLHIVIKLFNGYNVGVAAHRITAARETGYRRAVYKIPEKDFPSDPKKKNVTLLGTGGTIASRLDYRTGAVIPRPSRSRSARKSPGAPTASSSATVPTRWRTRAPS
jgi:glutamyl-tRNA(Gln) amidotransferase subunit D